MVLRRNRVAIGNSSQQESPMSSILFSRRKLFEAGAAAAVAAGLAAIPGAALARPAPAPGRESEFETLFREGDEERFRSSLHNAYLFLNTMMDAYAQGSTTRLSQSYSDEIGLESTAFVYDNAVEIMARLLRGSGQDLARAQVLGNGLLYAQQIDPAAEDREIGRASCRERVEGSADAGTTA